MGWFFDYSDLLYVGKSPAAEYLRLLREREREAGLRGDPETDAFLKAAALHGKRHSVTTEYIIRLLGLDVSARQWLLLPFLFIQLQLTYLGLVTNEGKHVHVVFSKANM